MPLFVSSIFLSSSVGIVASIWVTVFLLLAHAPFSLFHALNAPTPLPCLHFPVPSLHTRTAPYVAVLVLPPVHTYVWP